MHKNYPRDVLMNILVIIALYVSVFTFLNLIFSYINVALPDPLNPYERPADAIRWPLSVIIILFPAYIFASWFLYRDLRVNPEKNDSRIRRWLVFITIFAAGALIIGDLIALIFIFLQGELTWRFVFKISAILLTAVAVFIYYIYNLRKKPGEFSVGVKIFSFIIMAIVLATIIYGFVLAGSPFKQRLVRFDERKVSDLQALQSYIVNYWMQKEKLPKSSDDLIDSISGFIPPKDPQSGEVYLYKITGNLSFEICANFNLESQENPNQALPIFIEPQSGQTVKTITGKEESWAHKAGEICFKRSIDPDLYKPKKSD